MDQEQLNFKHVEALNLPLDQTETEEPLAPLAACDCDDYCGCDDICGVDVQGNCGLWG